MGEQLIPAIDLGHKQDEYLKRVDDSEMKHIIAVLNNAYMTSERYKIFEEISDHNIGKLRLAGYKVDHSGSQRDGYWYQVSW